MKRCRSCKRMRRRTSFYVNTWGTCKACRRKEEKERFARRRKEGSEVRKREYYARHKEKIAARVKARHAEAREWMNELKRRPCMDCGRVFPPCAMDFDHQPETAKKFVPSRLKSVSKKLAMEELSKCDVVCACCHRIRTYKRTHEPSERMAA